MISVTPPRSYKPTINQTVLSQTLTDYEWIIGDDFSNDDSRITVLKTNKNGGTAVARNVGLRHANGRYITFLDSDDLLDSDYLEKQLEFIKEHGPLISSGYRRKVKHTCTDFLVPEILDYKIALRVIPFLA